MIAFPQAITARPAHVGSAGDGQKLGDASPIVFILIHELSLQTQVCSLLEATGLHYCVFDNEANLLRVLPSERSSCLVFVANGDLTPAAQLQQRLRSSGVAIPLIAATTRGDVATAIAAVRAGVLDVLESHSLAERLVPSVLQAIAIDLAARSRQVSGDAQRQRFDRLTQRERDVLELVVQGLTSSGIAERLGLRTKTVEIYRSHINKKMGTRNAAELARLINGLR